MSSQSDCYLLKVTLRVYNATRLSYQKYGSKKRHKKSKLEHFCIISIICIYSAKFKQKKTLNQKCQSEKHI